MPSYVILHNCVGQWQKGDVVEEALFGDQVARLLKLGAIELAPEPEVEPEHDAEIDENAPHIPGLFDTPKRRGPGRPKKSGPTAGEGSEGERPGHHGRDADPDENE